MNFSYYLVAHNRLIIHLLFVDFLFSTKPHSKPKYLIFSIGEVKKTRANIVSRVSRFVLFSSFGSAHACHILVRRVCACGTYLFSF